MYRVIVFLLALASSASGLQLGARRGMQMNVKNGFDSFITTLKSKVMPAVVGASLLLNTPDVSNAVPSGGRSGGSSFRSSGGGGSSFRSPSSTRMYGSPSVRSYAPSPITVMPMYTPFYSPFGFSPLGFGGFMPINFNVLLIAGIAYVVYTSLKNRTGGSDFTGDGIESGSLGSGATVLKIQVALNSDWASSNNVMNTLSRLADKNSAMNGRNDLATLLNDASLALLRKQNDWNAAAYEGEYFNGGGRRAEPAFQQLAVKERAKFEEETSSVATIAPSAVGSTPTQVVVSIVVAMRGKSSGYLSGPVRSEADVARCLQGLATDALVDEGDNVMAVEVLWTPSEPGNTISPRELITDYPELLKL
jgi:uncharacterized membrane protein